MSGGSLKGANELGKLENPAHREFSGNQGPNSENYLKTDF